MGGNKREGDDFNDFPKVIYPHQGEGFFRMAYLLRPFRVSSQSMIPWRSEYTCPLFLFLIVAPEKVLFFKEPPMASLAFGGRYLLPLASLRYGEAGRFHTLHFYKVSSVKCFKYKRYLRFFHFFCSGRSETSLKQTPLFIKGFSGVTK